MGLEQERGQISFEEIISKAKETMLRDGKHSTMLIVDGGKNLVVGQISEMPDTHGERIEVMRFLGRATAKGGRVNELRQVFMVTEGWMSTASVNKPTDLRPSQDPNRKEVLIIYGVQIKEHKKQIKLLEIIRNQDEIVVNLEEFPEIGKNNEDEDADTPLLDAFVNGFRTAMQTKYN